MPASLPKHLSKLPEEHRHSAILRFKLRLAALYATDKGTIAALCELLGVLPPAMSAYLNSGSLPYSVRADIERICGVDDFPLSWFLPSAAKEKAHA